jgi:hypothetical protein
MRYWSRFGVNGALEKPIYELYELYIAQIDYATLISFKKSPGVSCMFLTVSKLLGFLCHPTNSRKFDAIVTQHLNPITKAPIKFSAHAFDLSFDIHVHQISFTMFLGFCIFLALNGSRVGFSSSNTEKLDVVTNFLPRITSPVHLFLLSLATFS